MQPCPRQLEAVMTVQRRHVSHWRDDGTCSYCGSISPDEFFKAIESGAEVVPTDKNYKAYIGNSKFYYQHFSLEDQLKFIDIYNSRKMAIGNPGYFYVLPFFMKLKVKDEE